MIEVTIPLSLPIRRVVAGHVDVAAPGWLDEEFARYRNPGGLPRLHQLRGAALSSVQRDAEQHQEQRANLARALSELRQATRQTNDQLKQVLNEVQEATVELAHAIASKLIFEQISANQFPIVNLVNEVLGRLNTHEPAIVRLHPEDLGILQEQQAFGSSSHERELKFVPDSSLARGDCKAKSGEISVVYELKHQIEEIRRQLLSAVSGHDEPGA